MLNDISFSENPGDLDWGNYSQDVHLQSPVHNEQASSGDIIRDLTSDNDDDIEGGGGNDAESGEN